MAKYNKLCGNFIFLFHLVACTGDGKHHCDGGRKEATALHRLKVREQAMVAILTWLAFDI
jgi:hypothetical protein